MIPGTSTIYDMDIPQYELMQIPTDDLPYSLR